eukprot:3763047-Amphidinium_carterae.1
MSITRGAHEAHNLNPQPPRTPNLLPCNWILRVIICQSCRLSANLAHPVATMQSGPPRARAHPQELRRERRPKFGLFRKRTKAPHAPTNVYHAARPAPQAYMNNRGASSTRAHHSHCKIPCLKRFMPLRVLTRCGFTAKPQARALLSNPSALGDEVHSPERTMTTKGELLET